MAICMFDDRDKFEGCNAAYALAMKGVLSDG
jgi:hypothetical protein